MVHLYVVVIPIATHLLVRTSTADKLEAGSAVQVDPLRLVFVEN
jgi:hypothetical protein